jgi:hypothetical protein
MFLRRLFLFLFLIGSAIGGAMAQHDPTHFVESDSSDGSNGSIREYREPSQGGNRTLFKVPVPVKRLLFTQSEQGKLLYLERPKKYVVESVEGYAPADEVTAILHVCDKTGKDLHVIPILGRYGSDFSNGRFYGESIVGLMNIGRMYGTGLATFVFLETGKIYTWRGLNWAPEKAEWEQISAFVSPDGKNLLWIIDDPEEQTSLAYLNGIMVYPRHDTAPHPSTFPPAEYKEKDKELTDWIRAHASNRDLAGGRRLFCPKGSWSSNSRYCVLVKGPYSFFRESAQPTTATLEALVIDTQLVTDKSPFGDYLRFVPLEKPPDASFLYYAKGRELSVHWDEGGHGVIEIPRQHPSESFRSGKIAPARLWKEAPTPPPQK